MQSTNSKYGTPYLAARHVLSFLPSFPNRLAIVKYTTTKKFSPFFKCPCLMYRIDLYDFFIYINVNNNVIK